MKNFNDSRKKHEDDNLFFIMQIQHEFKQRKYINKIKNI